MSTFQGSFLFSLTVLFALLVGCGSGSDQAETVADMDELAQYLAEHPEQDVDGLEDMDAETDLEE